MNSQRSILTKIIRVRNIKVALLVQSIVTTCAVLYMMFQTSTLDDAARLEIELRDRQCHGCCIIQNDTMQAISNEPRLSEKLHKFSRAIRNYDIPVNVMKILHDAEHKIEQFEIELKKFKAGKLDRLDDLQQILIEEDIGIDEQLVPKAKPKWIPKPKVTEKPVSKPNMAKNLKKEATKIANDVHNKINVKVPI